MINLDLYIRQMGLVDPSQLEQSIAVVGAGSIGSWVVLALCKLGCQSVKVFDFDTCEEHNAGSQVYSSLDVGKTKVEALQERLIGLVEVIPAVEVKKLEEGKTAFLKDFQIVISATDTINSRKWVFEGLEGHKIVLLDARMAGHLIQIFTVHLDNKKEVEFYKKTLFKAEETESTACSQRSIIYNCFVVAGFLADIVGRIGNQKNIPCELEIDLENFTLFK